MTNKKYKNRDWLYNQHVQEGKSAHQIAREIGMSQPAISRWVRRFGLKKKYKDRDWLYSQYIEQEKSSCQIAREIGTASNTIREWLYRFSIPTRNLGLAAHLASKNELQISPGLLSLLEGELLGDAGIYSYNRYSSNYQHGTKHKGYLQWLSKEFAQEGLEQMGKINTHWCNGKHGKYPWYSYASRYYSALNNLRKRFYLNGKKIVPEDFVLDPVKARHWYIGDGTIRCGYSKPAIILYTCDFARKSIGILRDQLHLNSIDSTYHPSVNSIYLGVKSALAFLDYIGPCPPEIESIYGYKWGR